MALKYKVKDRVRIKDIDWYNNNKNNKGVIVCGSESFTHPMSYFCNKVVNIITIQDDCYRILEDDGDWYWTDEMIECKVEEENKPKFKVGDEVRIKGTDIGGTIESIIRGQLIVETKGSKIPVWPEEVVLIKGLVEEETALNKWTGLKVELELSKSVIGVSNVESLHGERFMSGFVKAIIPPEGYQFVDENGNVINATKIVLEKKKKEYPKTYDECARLLGLSVLNELKYYKLSALYKKNSIVSFQKLLICRDAYWKIAGEEMGLGKPWKPDWNDEDEIKWVIFNLQNEIKLATRDIVSAILAFPTKEMRDAFYENFKELIEMCKEFL